MDRFVIVVEVDTHPSVVMQHEGSERISVETWNGERWIDMPADPRWFVIRTRGVGESYESRDAAKAAGLELFGVEPAHA